MNATQTLTKSPALHARRHGDGIDGVHLGPKKPDLGESGVDRGGVDGRGDPRCSYLIGGGLRLGRLSR